MVALGKSAGMTEVAMDRDRTDSGAQGRRWQLIGTYPTYEKAEQCCEMLRAQGTPCAVSMIGGLSVIAFN